MSVRGRDSRAGLLTPFHFPGPACPCLIAQSLIAGEPPHAPARTQGADDFDPMDYGRGQPGWDGAAAAGPHCGKHGGFEEGATGLWA
jgi:hypothetical protein